ncbi:MAG: serine kinase [Alphaproteobacteria bacterium]|nr:serine kinase [Alphaproteobacteria bacterium]
MAGATSRPVTAEQRLSPATVSQDGLAAYAGRLLEAARHYPRERLQRRSFAMPGLDLAVWFASPELADLCAAMLLQQDRTAASPHRAEVFALDADADGWDHPAGWDEHAGFSSREFSQILAAAGRRGFYHHDAPSWQFYDPADGFGVQSLPSGLAMPPWEKASPLRLFLHWAYAQAGMRLTHAATLGFDGRGALIVGASGSGKSGTTLAGVMNGLASVGDDYVAVAQGNQVTAYPVFRQFKQDPSGLRRAGVRLEAIPDSRLNWHGKIEFDPAGLAPGCIADQLEIRAILLPHVARLERTRIEPVGAREAALALVPSAVFQLPGDAEEGFRFFGSIAKRLPAYRLHLSEDPREIADTIASLLSQEAGHFR